jgi:hypothetical protein
LPNIFFANFDLQHVKNESTFTTESAEAAAVASTGEALGMKKSRYKIIFFSGEF